MSYEGGLDELSTPVPSERDTEAWLWGYLNEAVYEDHLSKAMCPMQQQKLLAPLQSCTDLQQHESKCRIQCLVCQQMTGTPCNILAGKSATGIIRHLISGDHYVGYDALFFPGQRTVEESRAEWATWSTGLKRRDRSAAENRHLRAAGGIKRRRSLGAKSQQLLMAPSSMGAAGPALDKLAFLNATRHAQGQSLLHHPTTFYPQAVAHQPQGYSPVAGAHLAPVRVVPLASNPPAVPTLPVLPNDRLAPPVQPTDGLHPSIFTASSPSSFPSSLPSNFAPIEPDYMSFAQSDIDDVDSQLEQHTHMWCGTATAGPQATPRSV